MILALPEGTDSVGVCDGLVEYINGLSELMKGTLTWGQGSEMARCAALTMAARMFLLR